MNIYSQQTVVSNNECFNYVLTEGPVPVEPEKKPQISSGSLSASDTSCASPSPGVTLRGGADMSQDKKPSLWGRALLLREAYNTSSLTFVSFPSGHTEVNDFDFQQNSGSWASFL